MNEQETALLKAISAANKWRIVLIFSIFLCAILAGIFVYLNINIIHSLDARERILESNEAMMRDKVITLDEISALVALAETAENRAFGYLGFFEVMGLAITVLGIVGAIVGLNLGMNVRDAQEEFKKTKTEFEDAKNQIRTLEQDLRSDFQSSVQNASITQLLMTMATQQYELGYLQGAKAIYERAMEISPNNPVIPYRIGYILTQMEELDEAEEILKMALLIDEKFAHAQAALGFVYRRKGDKLKDDKKAQDDAYRLAEKLLISSLRLNPYLVDDDGESWHGALGGLFRRQKKLDLAAKHYRLAVDITPQSSYPLLNLSMIEWEHKQFANLIPQLEKVAELVKRKIKKDKDTYWDRADILNIELALGESKETIDERLTTFLQVLPRDAKDILPRVISSTEFILNAPSFDADKRGNRVKIQAVLDALKAEAKKFETE